MKISKIHMPSRNMSYRKKLEIKYREVNTKRPSKIKKKKEGEGGNPWIDIVKYSQ